jgi:hypothetical protein
MAILFAGIARPPIIVLQILYPVRVGISRQMVGVLTIVLYISNIAGLLLFGYLGDKAEKRFCFIVSTTFLAVDFVSSTLVSTASQIIHSLIALGIDYGGFMPLAPHYNWNSLVSSPLLR